MARPAPTRGAPGSVTPLGLEHNFAASTHNRASVMDYPPPFVALNANGDIDLSNAYPTGIGEWDKIAIRYGYTPFAPDAERAGLFVHSQRSQRQRSDLHFRPRRENRRWRASSRASLGHRCGTRPMISIASCRSARKRSPDFSEQKIASVSR